MHEIVMREVYMTGDPYGIFNSLTTSFDNCCRFC